jgi:hypothetical protein
MRSNATPYESAVAAAHTATTHNYCNASRVGLSLCNRRCRCFQSHPLEHKFAAIADLKLSWTLVLSLLVAGAAVAADEEREEGRSVRALERSAAVPTQPSAGRPGSSSVLRRRASSCLALRSRSAGSRMASTPCTSTPPVPATHAAPRRDTSIRDRSGTRRQMATIPTARATW